MNIVPNLIVDDLKIPEVTKAITFACKTQVSRALNLSLLEHRKTSLRQKPLRNISGKP